MVWNREGHFLWFAKNDKIIFEIIHSHGLLFWTKRACRDYKEKQSEEDLHKLGTI